jgi:secondary thiamine-phosphate synthase enzyme
VGVYRDTIAVKSRGDCDIIDVTARVADVVDSSGIVEGLAHVFVAGSTAGITTVEYESGLVSDLREVFERIAAKGADYAHDARWQDGNGHAHVRASLLGPSLTVPVGGGEMLLGTWQQVILIDFDNRPRTRELIVQVLGE